LAMFMVNVGKLPYIECLGMSKFIHVNEL